jgi:tetratricopeptide (TPR) repeat protein
LQLIHRRANREDQSEQVGKEALAIARQLPDAGPELSAVLDTLALNAVKLRGDYVEAERLTRESIALHRRFHGDKHPRTALALSYLGMCLAERGDYAQAEAHLRESIAIFTKNYSYITDHSQGFEGSGSEISPGFEGFDHLKQLSVIGGVGVK